MQASVPSWIGLVVRPLYTFGGHPSDYQKKARNGSDVFVSGTLPSYWDQQRHPKDFTKQQQMRQKLAKIEMK